MNSVLSLASVLMLTILILYLSYLFTKSLGKGIGLKRGGTCLQILERLSLGQDKAVAIVRMGCHYYLIGIASSQITLLAEVSEDDINMEMNKSLPSAGGEGYPDFKMLLKKYTDRHKKDE